MKQAVRIGNTPLAVQVLELPTFVVAQWIGSAPEGAGETAAEASREILARAGERLVLDLGRLETVCSPAVRILVLLISEAQRLGRSVCLVRCQDELFARLRESGLTGAVNHAGSLLAATGGLAGDPANTVDLYVRSSPELLHRLRNVVTAVAREAGLDGEGELQLKTAVTEAAANAILHGSPEGPRNHVRVSFYLEGPLLIVDVADQGRGFDPGRVPLPRPTDLREHGYGIHLIRQAMDRVEFYRDEGGMLVRMTKYLSRMPEGWADAA